MKATFERDELLRTLQAANIIVPKRTPKPILGYVRMDCAEDESLIHATNLETTLVCKLGETEVTVPGEALLPARLVTQILQICRDEKLELESLETTVRLCSERSQFEFPTPDPMEYPEGRFSAESYYEVSSRLLHQIIMRTDFVVDPKDSRYALTGIYFEVVDDTLYAVATDGRRMAVQESRVDYAGEQRVNQSVIVPLQSAKLLKQLVNGNDDDLVKFAVQYGTAQFAIGSAVVTLQPIEGQFPKWRNVLPKEPVRAAVALKVGELLSATRQAATVTDEEHRSVVYRLTAGNMIVSSHDSPRGESRIQLPIDYEREELSMCLNPHFVIDFLEVLDGDQTITWNFRGPKTAVEVGTDDGYQHLLMPIELKEE